MMVYMVRSHTWTRTNILERTTNKYSCSIHYFPFFPSFPPDMLEHSVWKCQRNVLLLNPVKKVNQHFEPHMNNKKWMFFLAECHTSFPTHPPTSHFNRHVSEAFSQSPRGESKSRANRTDDQSRNCLACVCVWFHYPVKAVEYIWQCQERIRVHKSMMSLESFIHLVPEVFLFCP